MYLSLDNLLKYILCADCIRVKSKLEEAVEKTDNHNIIVQAATRVREQIKGTPCKNKWPPQPNELTADYVTLQTVVRVLLGASLGGSTRVNRSAWSIAQDVITAVSVGVVKTPKHVFFPVGYQHSHR